MYDTLLFYWVRNFFELQKCPKFWSFLRKLLIKSRNQNIFQTPKLNHNIMLLQPLSNEQFTTECFTISRLFRISQISKRGYYLMFRSFQIVSQFSDYFTFFSKKFLSFARISQIPVYPRWTPQINSHIITNRWVNLDINCWINKLIVLV